MIKGKTDLTNLKKIPRELRQNKGKFYQKFAELIQKSFLEETQKHAPRDTGKYANSWDLGSIDISGNKITITIETPMGELYLILEEEGSDPHLINGPVLIKGVGWRYIKKHPGFPPMPHVLPAIRRILDTKLQEFYEESARECFPDIFK